eukprot:COSAG04_NODE_24837_length_316_cov_0.718894_1_plen_41_part_01
MLDLFNSLVLAIDQSPQAANVQLPGSAVPPWFCATSRVAEG